jgi:hypothetical protein
MNSQVADSVNNYTAGLTGGVDWGDLLTGGGGYQIRQTHKNMILHFIISLYIYMYVFLCMPILVQPSLRLGQVVWFDSQGFSAFSDFSDFWLIPCCICSCHLVAPAT